MRGKVGGTMKNLNVPRITPAYAGKSCPSTGCILPCWDHPRICGEKLLRVYKFGIVKGSPPHMRGKASGCCFLGVSIGITPAYAGKSQGCHQCRLRCEDHPRICGEKTKKIDMGATVYGSPPHMRGKEGVGAVHVLEQGITPAYAGKSAFTLDKRRAVQDHPRICGEKSLLDERRERQVGSPPHMRGKGHRTNCHSVHLRITPAYAGKRGRSELHGLQPQDHPRICGEKRKSRT